MKKVLRETQTLRAGCSKAEPKISPRCRPPFLGPQDRKNLISWRWSLYLYLQTQFGEDWCTQFRVIVVTDPQTYKHTHRQDRLQYTAPQLARSVIKITNRQYSYAYMSARSLTFASLTSQQATRFFHVDCLHKKIDLMLVPSLNQ